MDTIEVFAEIACPFAHVGLHGFAAARERQGCDRPRLRVRAWPLELVNAKPFDGHALVAKVDALRSSVAPDRFSGFDPDRFPSTSLPALAAEAAAHRAGVVQGERFSLVIRDALFEQGFDIGDVTVVNRILADTGLAPVGEDDFAAVLADHGAGRALGVVGSPHFFTSAESFFCPSLAIEHDGDDIEVTIDREGFDRFLAAALG